MGRVSDALYRLKVIYVDADGLLVSQWYVGRGAGDFAVPIVVGAVVVKQGDEGEAGVLKPCCFFN